MTHQNNAAQAAAQILTYLGFAQAVSMEPAADPRRDHIQALIESALLSKLRAPVSDIREGFELTYAADADDPACASDLSHFTNGWRACIMPQVRAPVADERAAFEKRFSVPPENWTKSGGGGYRNIWIETRWEGWRARAALASAPVSDTLPLEKALHELVSKIAPGLDTGDILQDARQASAMLGSIMASAPVAQAEVTAALDWLPLASPSDETLRLAGVIADKIEDGTLFQAGIFSRRELADKVRTVVRLARQSAPVADERALPPLPEHFYSWYWCAAPEYRQRPLMHGEDAPQASEAVRDALMAFDEAMRLCDDFPELQHHRDALLFAVQKARAALSAQAADKPAISSPSSAGNPCPAPVPADPETGNSHTDGGAVYG